MSPAQTIGIRLERARKAAGLTLRALGEAVGVSHTLIAKYEAGKLTPNSTQLIAAAKALSVKVEYFLRPAKLSQVHVEYRMKSRQSAKEQRQVEAAVLDLAERRFELEQFFPTPPTATFAVPSAVQARISSYAEAENAADEIRRAWKLGHDPISSLIDILEAHGVRVFASRGCDKVFDGLMMHLDVGSAGKWPIILIDDQWPGDRQRFTLAHELGHLVLHGRLNATDAAGVALKEETACNRFAGAFLLPGDVLRRQLGANRTGFEPRELQLLKSAYGASMACILYRAKDLGIISEALFATWMAGWRQKGWHMREPGEQIPAERPRLFEHLVYRALAENYIGESKAAELLGLTAHEFHARRLLDDATTDTPDGAHGVVSAGQPGIPDARPHQ
jgi:Zn-dependent peptidase ImmA (M78 family)/DNA-binding XRE family transcriptional regulator